MKNIKVIYNDGVGTLHTKLKNKIFNIEKISKEEFNIEIRDQEEYRIFINILNKFLIKEHFNKATSSIMSKKGYMQEHIDIMLSDDSIKNIDKVDYFTVATEILLLEYFKVMDVINITAFINLNMKGFKDEAKHVIETAEGYIADSIISEDDEDEAIDYIEATSYALSALLDSNTINVDDFREISIKLFKDDTVEIIDMKGDSHSIDSLSDQVGIEIGILFGDNNSQLESSILFTSLIISIMKPKKVIVGKGCENFKQILNVYLCSMGIVANIVGEK